MKIMNKWLRLTSFLGLLGLLSWSCIAVQLPQPSNIGTRSISNISGHEEYWKVLPQDTASYDSVVKISNRPVKIGDAQYFAVFVDIDTDSTKWITVGLDTGSIYILYSVSPHRDSTDHYKTVGVSTWDTLMTISAVDTTDTTSTAIKVKKSFHVSSGPNLAPSSYMDFYIDFSGTLPGVIRQRLGVWRQP